VRAIAPGAATIKESFQPPEAGRQIEMKSASAEWISD